jgi:hypothetical protein
LYVSNYLLLPFKEEGKVYEDATSEHKESYQRTHHSKEEEEEVYDKAQGSL